MCNQQNLVWIVIFFCPELNTCHQAKSMFILCVPTTRGEFDTHIASSQQYAKLQGNVDQKSAVIKKDHPAKLTTSHHLSRLLSEMISIWLNKSLNPAASWALSGFLIHKMKQWSCSEPRKGIWSVLNNKDKYKIELPEMRLDFTVTGLFEP